MISRFALSVARVAFKPFEAFHGMMTDWFKVLQTLFPGDADRPVMCWNVREGDTHETSLSLANCAPDGAASGAVPESLFGVGRRSGA